MLCEYPLIYNLVSSPKRRNYYSVYFMQELGAMEVSAINGLEPKLFIVSKKSCEILFNILILLYINKYYIK